MKILLEYQKNVQIIKSSRFIAEAFCISSAQESREKLHEQKQKYFDSSHVCHAFICGSQAEVNGMSDDGEPSGTAGRPMLDVLKGSEITNILVTITRYFGGTLLGTGGLVHAYSNGTKELLALCKTEELVKKLNFTFLADYSFYEEIKRHFSEFNISQLSEDFSSNVNLSGKIYSSQKEEFSALVKNLSKGKSQVLYGEDLCI